KLPWNAKPEILNLEDLPRFGCGKVFRFAGHQERGDQLLSSTDAGDGYRMCSPRHSGHYNSQCTRRLRYGDVRPAKRPAASECHVHAQAESAGLVRRKAQIIDKFIGEIGERSEERRVGKECRSRRSPYD